MGSVVWTGKMGVKEVCSSVGEVSEGGMEACGQDV